LAYFASSAPDVHHDHGRNKMEMAVGDLPPHFGAWCEGKLGSKPAYVSFFPNAFHKLRAASPIALNAAFGAENRAQWAMTCWNHSECGHNHPMSPAHVNERGPDYGYALVTGR
jgi:hypothetical protein